jgi:hypothetical protein
MLQERKGLLKVGEREVTVVAVAPIFAPQLPPRLE